MMFTASNNCVPKNIEHSPDSCKTIGAFLCPLFLIFLLSIKGFCLLFVEISESYNSKKPSKKHYYLTNYFSLNKNKLTIALCICGNGSPCIQSVNCSNPYLVLAMLKHSQYVDKLSSFYTQ